MSEMSGYLKKADGTLIEIVDKAARQTVSTKANSVHTHSISDVTGLQVALDGKDTAITNESTARTNADTALQTAITNESTARAAADTAEATARAAADTAEATARAAADEELKSDLTSHISSASVVYDYDLRTNLTTTTYPTGFRTGYYDRGNGTATSSSHMLRSVRNTVFSGSESKMVIQAPAGKGVYVSEFDSSGTFVKTYGSSVQQSLDDEVSVPITAGNIYKFSIGYWTEITNETITNDIVDGYTVTVYATTDATLTQAGKSADAKAVGDALEKMKLKVYIKHQSGSYASGNATERLFVYTPASDGGYIKTALYHFVDSDINCNGWQVYHAYHVDDLNDTNQADLTITGEWECALHLKDRDDFSGGHTHGDEIMQAVNLFVDGKNAEFTDFTTLTAAQEVRIIQPSVFYDPEDHTTQIAIHGKEWIFNAEDCLKINQSVKWLVEEDLTNCFLCMFLPSKTKTDRAYFNTDFSVRELSESNFSYTLPKANKVNIWKNGGGFVAEVYTTEYPTGLTDGDRMSLSDNGGLSYNKFYWKVCGEGQTSTVGEVWKSSAVYKMDYI